MPKSKTHHWWPVGLQSYWKDKSGDIWWIEPNGKTDKKRVHNRKVGQKRYGHTISRGTVWERNFEDEFDIDDRVHEIIAVLDQKKPLGPGILEVIAKLASAFRKGKTLSDMCRFYDLDDAFRRELLLLVLSLLIRSPARRSEYENYTQLLDLPADEEVGKLNMLTAYQVAKKICQAKSFPNLYVIILHASLKKFICGDGYLDWISNSMWVYRLRGRALIPLTPKLCVYLCTPNPMRSPPNCASLAAPPWMVDQINEFTQIYSKDRLFFKGKPPTLSEFFTRREFLRHAKKELDLISTLDEIAGIPKTSGLLAFGANFNGNR